MIINNHEAVLKALVNIKKKVVDGCELCHGQELGCRCRFRMMLIEQAAKANAPIGLLTKTFSDFGVGQLDNAALMDLKEKWRGVIYGIEDIVASGKTIVVSGSNGTGKTMMATIAMKSAIASHFTCQYILFNQLVDAFLSKDMDDVLDHVSAVDLLVIDEIGKEYKKTNQFGEYDATSNMAAYCRYVFEHVVKMRADACLPTILVTNDSLDELDVKYGGVDSALSSILRSFTVLQLFHTGIDFRGIDVRR